MGDLIVMTRPTGQIRREASRETSAQILFFTGVRYYRMPDHEIVEDIVASPVRRRTAKARKAAEAKRLKRQA